MSKDKRRKKEDFSCEILNIIDVLEEGSKNWATVLMKVSWNDKPPVLDVRKLDMASIDDEDNIKMGKGISISDEGFERLAIALLKEGFVPTDILQDIIDSREDIFKQPTHKIKLKRK